MAVEERDPHSGYLTTGHEWNGITELNRPVPKVIWLFLFCTVAFAVAWWVLMPAWPLGVTYTRGLLGVDQRARIIEDLARADARRATWMTEIATKSYAEIRADETLMRFTREAGHTLFADNCAACHGSTAQGGPGYPNLTDKAWLWGGDPETVAETIRVGINADHDDTRISQMLAFGRDGMLDRNAILNVITYVQSLSNPAAIRPEDRERLKIGSEIFAENCSSCHGATGQGSTEMGAPDLSDDFWIYGGDRQSLYTTVYYGRHGQMPSWESRLSETQRKILTLYILDLGEKQP